MKKRLFLLLFAALSLLPLYAYDFEVDGIYYNINSRTSTCSVTYRTTSYNSYSGDIVIPESVTYNGTEYFVTKIGSDAFRYCSALTSVVIPNSVTYIGMYYTFLGCSGLTSIRIPNSVTTIGDYVFDGCTSLTNLIIEDGEPTLSIGYSDYETGLSGGKGLFYDCPVETLYLGRNLRYTTGKSCGYSPFYGKSSLKEVTIGNFVTEIGESAFRSCSGLTSVVIPNSVTTIGGDAFAWCRGLIKSAYPNTISNPFTTGITISYPSDGVITEDGVIYNKYKETLYFVPMNLSGDFEIPESVTAIGDDAFRACSELNSIAIPNSVSEIGAGAFAYCSSLSTIILPKSISKIEDSVFDNCTNLSSVNLQGEITGIGKNAFANCSSLTSISIPGAVTEIKNDAFTGCAGLKTVSFEEGIAPVTLGKKNTNGAPLFSDAALEQLHIGKNIIYTVSPFKGQSNLQSLTFGKQLTEIGNSMFQGCSELKELTISEKVQNIGNNAFDECSGLTEILFESGKEPLEVGDNASGRGLFHSSKLESVYLGRNLSYTTAPFAGQTELKSVTIDKSVTELGDSFFQGCSGLESIVIPESVTGIGANAFAGCSQLKSMDLPMGLTEIKDNTFENCSALSFVNIPENLSSIGKSAFAGCSALTEIEIPQSVISIGSSVFNGCSALTNITLQDGAEPLEIGDNGSGRGLFNSSKLESVYLGRNLSYTTAPFAGQTELKSVTIDKSVTELGASFFQGCSGLKSIVIPESVTGIGANAFAGCSQLKSMVLPLGVTEIKDNTFENCSALSFVGLPENLRSLGKSAFAGCSALTEIEIPQSVISIGSSTFNGCSALINITLQDGAEPLEIGDNGSGRSLFNACPIETLYLGRNMSYTVAPFMGRTALKSLTIGSAVSEIGNSAFQGCNSLIELTIPETVASIGNNAFAACSGISAVIIEDSEETLELGDNGSGMGLFNACPIETLYLGRNLSYSVSPFKNQIALTDLKFSKNITELGFSSFEGCTGLSGSILIPETITSIGESAFKNCTGFSGVLTLPASVSQIGNNAFAGCSGFTSLNIVDGNTPLTLGNNDNGKGLFDSFVMESLYLGRDLEYQISPFMGQTSLTSLTIGTTVTEIGNSAFMNCTGLSEINLPASVRSIGDMAFKGCSGFSGLLTLGTSVESIGASSFQNCVGVTELFIPETVKSIGNDAFGGCIYLFDVTSRASNAPSLLTNSFSEPSYETAIVNIPSGSLKKYQTEWSRFKHLMAGEATSKEYNLASPGTLVSKINMSEVNNITSLKLIGEINGTDLLALNKIVNILDLDLSEATIVSGGMTYYEEDNIKYGTEDNTIGNYWAYALNAVRKVKLPTNLIKIDDAAFKNKYGLEAISIPGAVTSIGNGAFSNCIKLSDIAFEDGVGTLALGNNGVNGLLMDCPIENVYLGRDLAYSYSPFRDKTSIEKLTIGNLVTAINDYCFSNCIGIEGELSLPDNLIVIGKNAFDGCKGFIGKLSIPDDVTQIGSHAFDGCLNFNSLYIGSSVANIGNYAFRGCYNISDLNIADGLGTLSIGTNGSQNIFYDCPIETLYMGRPLECYSSFMPFIGKSTLKGVILGSGVQKVNNNFFSNCSSLSSLEIKNGVASIGNSSFTGCSSLTDLKIPNSVNLIGNNAFSKCETLERVMLPMGLTSVNESVFENCSALTSVTIPGGVRYIRSGAFKGCSSLESVNMINPIPAVIEEDSFDFQGTLNVPAESKMYYWIHPLWSKFPELEAWNVGSDVDFAENSVTYHITSEENATVEITAATLMARSGGSLTVPEAIRFNDKVYTVAGIANNAFCNMMFETVELPQTIAYIGLNAFSGCSALKSLTVNAQMPPSVARESFDDTVFASATLFMPETSREEYESDPVWSLFISKDIAVGLDDVNVTEDANVEVYDLKGVKIANGTEGLPRGIYIVRRGTRVSKITI